jgi:hypothetical protein
LLVEMEAEDTKFDGWKCSRKQKVVNLACLLKSLGSPTCSALEEAVSYVSYRFRTMVVVRLMEKVFQWKSFRRAGALCAWQRRV